MQTDDLIRALADDLRPVATFALERRLGAGIGLGAAATAILVVSCLGVRPDLARALAGSVFWMKFAYTLALAIIALMMTARLARPDAPRGGPGRWLPIPVVALGCLAIVELARAPMTAWTSIWLGHSARVCPFLILSLAIPIYLGLAWAFRGFAPTRLEAAGAAAGLASGGFAAAIYCLHCPESSASFVLTWYSLGIVLATLGGRLAGPKLLRW